MQRNYLIFKPYKMLNLVLILLLFSCKEIPCLENTESLNEVRVENGGHIWNCGAKFWEADQSDVLRICDLIGGLDEINPKSVRLSNWRLDIYINGEEEKLFAEHLSLYNTKNSGYIFRKNENYYSNNEFAEYLILKIGITNSNSSPCKN